MVASPPTRMHYNLLHFCSILPFSLGQVPLLIAAAAMCVRCT